MAEMSYKEEFIKKIEEKFEIEENKLKIIMESEEK